MIASSITLTNIDVNKFTEATLQKFAAGLILGAVASELFPLMLENVSEANCLIGVSIGFFISLILLNTMEKFIDYIIDISTIKTNLNLNISTASAINNNDICITTGKDVEDGHNSDLSAYQSMKVSIDRPISQIFSKLEQQQQQQQLQQQDNSPFEVTSNDELKQELYRKYMRVFVCIMCLRMHTCCLYFYSYSYLTSYTSNMYAHTCS